MKYTPVGVDIAKHLMQIHFIDESTPVKLSINKLSAMPCWNISVIVNLALSEWRPVVAPTPSSGHVSWKSLGHKVKLLQGKFVRAFVMGNKNDVMDARAIWMAVQQPAKSVAVKTEEHQVVLSLHKIWCQLVKFRTAQINTLHGLLLEFGEIVHKGRASLDKGHARAARASEGEAAAVPDLPD